MRTVFLACLLAALLADSGRANSYLYRPLTLPKAADIIAFSNGMAPPVGFRRPLTKKQVLRFLERGRNNTDLATWPPAGGDSYNSVCDGVIVDKVGQVYFWTLASKRGLRLDTDDGRSAYIQLR